MTYTFELLPQMGHLCLRRVTHVLCCYRRHLFLFSLPLGILHVLDGILPLLL